MGTRQIMAEEDTIDLRELFGVLIKKLWTIILAAIVVGVAAFGYTYIFIDPLYEASALMYVNNSDISIGSTSVSITAGELTAAQELVDTYVVILESRNTLEDVIEQAGVDYTYDEMKDMISAEAVNSTEVFEVVVTSTDPYEAETIANTIAEVLPDKIADIVVGSDVRIVDYAVVPAYRSSPSYTRNTAIGALLGAVLSVAVIVVAYMLDEKIHNEEYLSLTYPDIPLLATIPDMNETKQREDYYYAYRRPVESRSAARPKTSRAPSERASGAGAEKTSNAKPKASGASAPTAAQKERKKG